MQKITISLLLLLGALISCTSPKSGTGIYHLDPKTWPTQTIDLERVVKEIRIVPLETRPECLMSYIGQMQFSSDMILTLDGETNQILCFGRQGEFLQKFGTRGKGPGEYTTVSGILLNPEKSMVLLNRSPAPRVNFFNLSGQFLRSVDQEFSGYRMAFITNDLVAVHAGRFGFNKVRCELVVLDQNGKIKKTYFPYKETVSGDQCFGFAVGNRPGSVLYHRDFDYHIYEVNAGRIDTLLTFDFGSATIDTGKFLNTEEVDKLRGYDGKIFGLTALANTPDHLLVNINYSKGRVAWILDHQTKNNQYLAIDTISSIGQFKGIPVHFPRHTDGAWFVADLDGMEWAESINKLTEAQKVILRKEIPGFIEAEKVAIDGNPVLVFYRFNNI
jgi:hypothetical protein